MIAPADLAYSPDSYAETSGGGGRGGTGGDAGDNGQFVVTTESYDLDGNLTFTSESDLMAPSGDGGAGGSGGHGGDSTLTATGLTSAEIFSVTALALTGNGGGGGGGTGSYGEDGYLYEDSSSFYYIQPVQGGGGGRGGDGGDCRRRQGFHQEQHLPEFEYRRFGGRYTIWVMVATVAMPGLGANGGRGGDGGDGGDARIDVDHVQMKFNATDRLLAQAGDGAGGGSGGSATTGNPATGWSTALAATAARGERREPPRSTSSTTRLPVQPIPDSPVA
ncbi:MAG: hypothetical protein WDN06_05310 [Asticcacaulis sp.]